MSNTVDAGDRSESLKTVGHISYFLHTVVAVGAVIPGGQVSTALLIVALILDLVKKDDAQGTWQESHFRYRIRSVLWATALYILTAPLWFFLLLPGWAAWTLVSIWFLYRVVRGWVRLNRNQPMPD
jgi:uncharacterized membrane protein